MTKLARFYFVCENGYPVFSARVATGRREAETPTGVVRAALNSLGLLDG